MALGGTSTEIEMQKDRKATAGQTSGPSMRRIREGKKKAAEQNRIHGRGKNRGMVKGSTRARAILTRSTIASSSHGGKNSRRLRRERVSANGYGKRDAHLDD